MIIRKSVCAVTGAARGLGRQITRTLLEQGATVYGCDLETNGLQELREEWPETLHAIACDVSDESSVQDLFAEVRKQEERLDILVNNAGITRDGLLVKLKDDKLQTLALADFRQVIEVNLTGTFLCAREAASMMARQGGGLIINISSVCRAGNFGQTNYSASKAGVDAMTVTWAKELARYGIRVAAIAPGYINTEMVAAIRPDMLEKIRAQIPCRRLGEMDEIARTVAFIIENDYISGRIIEVDGALRI